MAAGVDQRLVALNVDDQLGGIGGSHLGRAIGAGGVVGAGHADGRPEVSGFFEDAFIVSGNRNAGQVLR